MRAFGAHRFNAPHHSVSELRANSVPGLTDLSVRNLPEGLHLDARLPSFGIRVGKKRKTWIVIKGKNRTKISLGHYPAMSLADARKRAMVELSKPPSVSEAANTPSYPEALAEFHTLHVTNLRPRSAYQLSRNLTRHCLWTKPLDQITHQDVLNVLDGIEGRSSASARPERHSHLLQLVHSSISQVVTLCRHQETRSEVARARLGRR